MGLLQTNYKVKESEEVAKAREDVWAKFLKE